MQTIWKYGIGPDSVLEMPKGSKILTVQAQNEIPRIWVLVDPSQPKEPRRFKTYGTGHTILDDEALNYIGTFQLNFEDTILVFHTFEVK